MGLLAALAVNAVAYATGGQGVAWVAPMLGFGNSDIAAGSVAAAVQSHYGNVEAGSVIPMGWKLSTSTDSETVEDRLPQPDAEEAEDL